MSNPYTSPPAADGTGRDPAPPLPAPWTWPADPPPRPRPSTARPAPAPPPPAAAPPPAARRIGATGVLALAGTFIAFLDATVVNIAVPDIVAGFPHAGLSTVSWVLNAYNVLFAAFLVPAGRAADRWGTRRTFLLGTAVFTGASALCGLAPSIGALVAARTVQAAGAALLVPAALALLLPLFPGRRTAAATLFSAVAAVASGVGPSIGGALVELRGWELAFWVNVPIGAATLLLGRLRLAAAPSRPGGAVPDFTGGAGAAGAVGALALALVQGPEWGWADGRILALLAAAAACTAYTARRIARHPAPVVDRELFRLPAFTRANALSLFFATAFFATVLCNVLFLTGVWHYSLLRAGFAVTPAPLAAAAAAGPAGRLAERLGARPVVLAGAAAFAAACALYAGCLGEQPAFAARWLPIALLSGTGIGMVLPVLSGVALSPVAADRFATASAVNSAARQVGAVLGTSLLVAVTGSAAGAGAGRAACDRGWWAASGLAALSAAGAALLPRRPRRLPPAT